jgi:hypothetical protein
MSEPPLVLELSLGVSREELLRNLGYPPSHPPSRRVQRRLEVLVERAPDLVEARGACRFVTPSEAAAASVPRPTDPLGLGLCTIGPALEREGRALLRRGEMLDALLLDAYGSAAAEAAADALNHRLCRAARARGLHLRPRFSPGYGRWNVRHQRQLLALLPAGELGVALTEGMMMVPRKSVSFAARMLAAPATVRSAARRCRACDLADCDHREAAFAGPGQDR